MALDPRHNIYVTGYTYSTDFPIVRAFQSQNRGFIDGFVTKLDSQASNQVPVALEVEDIGLFNLRWDAIAESKLERLRPGRLRFRARTVCPGISMSTVIPATTR